MMPNDKITESPDNEIKVTPIKGRGRPKGTPKKKGFIGTPKKLGSIL